MNIVYYLRYFPKVSESFILNEIYELDKKGHNIAVCSLHEPDNSIIHDEFRELKIPIKYLHQPQMSMFYEVFSTKVLNPRILRNVFYSAPLKHHAANLFRAKQCIDFVNSLDWDPDHFHSHFAFLSGFGAKYASDYYEVPFSITTHASDLYKNPVGTYTSSLLQRANRIITISEYNKKYIRKHFDSETPIDIIRAGIRPEKFSPTETTEPNRVLTISRLVEKKGIRYALEAINLATKQVPDIEYHIIGSGELEEELVQQTIQLGIEDNVTFLNNVSDQELVTELDEARCFLLPCVIADSGDRDGIPVALMEAMAMKTPPVSTTVSGIPELIDHEQNGLLTEPRNSEATADALLTLLQDDSKWSSYSDQARDKVDEDFNIEHEANRLENIFKDAQSH